MRASNAVERITVAAAIEAGSGNSVGNITPTDADTDTAGVHEVDLSVGTTTIRIPVTSGGSLRTYTVAVTRVSSSASNDTKLSSLRLSNVTLSPAFDSDERTGYTDRVPNSVSLTTVTARAANSGAMVDIRYEENSNDFSTTTFDGEGEATDSANVVPLGVGNTAIGIKVTAADVSTVGYYTAFVTRAADTDTDVATLATLELTNGALHPSYDPDKTAYTASVPYTTRDTAVTATATNDTGTVVTITSDMDDDIDGDEVDLEVGANVITIKVDAANAIATKTYTVTVTRASATASADTNLSSLNLSRVTLSPAFDPGKTAYTDIGAELRRLDDRDGQGCQFGRSG